MGFLSGRATLRRFRVSKRPPRHFGPDHLERLTAHASGRQRVASADGSEVGWNAGDHILDTRFELEKNVIDDSLHFALRVDRVRLPADLLRAYTQIELEAIAAEAPGGRVGARQKRDARLAAREKLEAEARDGRFLSRRAYPILWDAQAHELWLGSTSSTAVERLHGLFQTTFAHGLEAVGAGRRAFLLAEARGQTRGVDDARLTSFAPGGPADVAWDTDETSRDFLGNEFLLWLWFVLDDENDTIALADGSEAAVMLARGLVLECPRAQTGRETIRSDAPAALPEALRAIQAGKLPRQAGLTVVRHDRQYEFTVHAETLAVTGAKLPAPEAEDPRAALEERVSQLRYLMETVDLLYDAFGRRRFSADWPKDVSRLRKWLGREPRSGATAAG